MQYKIAGHWDAFGHCIFQLYVHVKSTEILHCSLICMHLLKQFSNYNVLGCVPTYTGFVSCKV